MLDERESISTKTMITGADGSEETIFVSRNFCQPDADVTMVSGDGVRFHVHTKNLAFNTGGFPPIELTQPSNTREQVVLSERSHILDLLFQFIYPQRYPDIKSLNINTLSELADAAEKYEVYGAISTCNIIMKFSVAKHPVEVFAYATPYNYMEIADEAAPLVLGTPPSTFAKKLTADALVGWIHYLGSCDPIRRTWITTIIQTMNRSRRLSGYGPPDCPLGCKSLEPLLIELSTSMIPLAKLSSLLDGITCTHCKPYVIRLGAPDQYRSFAKFQSFMS